MGGLAMMASFRVEITGVARATGWQEVCWSGLGYQFESYAQWLSAWSKATATMLDMARYIPQCNQVELPELLAGSVKHQLSQNGGCKTQVISQTQLGRTFYPKMELFVGHLFHFAVKATVFQRR
jgi:hypothetical protein